MSLVVAGIVAAVASAVAGVVAVQRARRRAAAPTHGEAGDATQIGGEGSAQAPPGAQQAAAEAPPASIPTAFRGLPVAIGDVVQVDDETRWPRSALVLRHGSELHTALLLSASGAERRCVGVFAPPHKHIWWMDRVEIDLPPGAPTRLEIGRSFLDRSLSLPVGLEPHGADPPELGDDGVLAAYEGPVGDVAIVLRAGGSTFVWAGRQIEVGDFDNLGQVDPHKDELGSR